ncbi:hypothetical protein [Corynebacterium diphtheriae]|uniref:hypothetical protein n=1 Tax=Corynebacterium diphtheriae TaxID=1717 RepID=UPI0015C2C5A8|nr:hypothetical protein [Corynebacterium diphtheriae]MBG9335446.1 hypothetical protein [Corynebacterium diphtheriae bv. gravis]
MFHDVTLTRNSVTLKPERIDDSFRVDYFSVIREECPQVQQRLEQRVDTLLARTRNE